MSAVYRQYSRDELEVQYNARGTVPDVQVFVDRYAQESAAVRARIAGHLNLAYGPSADETLDIFPAVATPRPTLVFIHGGYWRMLTKNESGFMAETFTRAGASVAVLNYALAPAATLDEIVGQTRRAIDWLIANGARYGIDREQLYVVGTSAGGHLGGMVLASHAIAGACLISGLFDLEPVRMCLPNTWLQLDAEGARRNSPIHHLPACGCPLIISYAGTDTDEFKRQSRDYLAAWQARGFPGELLEMPAHNHFDIVLDLADLASPLTRAVLHQMKLA